MPSPNIWIAASDNDVASVGEFLARDPSAVNAHDENGYTPIHAAASYNHIPLLRSLVRTHGGNANVTDLDGDTPLFVVETVETARCLVEELGADVNWRNESGLTAADVIEEDAQFPLVAAYLREKQTPPSGADSSSSANGLNGALINGANTNDLDAIAPPEGLQVKFTTVEEAGEDQAPADPELRRRIEELAQRPDFDSEEVQRELRELVTGAVRGTLQGGETAERSVRPKAGESSS
ncbi:ankyrin [Ascodesmis nigricans]|uniref:Ankyrin n=1 Tax=Ascodesmis nigricans TaxID=341454 RepID=A0A4S2MTC4_9PEZI|nr:ankyrin [Ascodesmis nigricans]